MDTGAHLSVVFKAKESVPGIAAEGGTLLNRHIGSPGHLGHEGAAVGRLGVAAAGGVSRESGNLGVRGAGVQGEAVPRTTRLSRVSGTGEGAVGQRGFDAAVVDGVAAVALPAVLDAKVLELGAGGGALLNGHEIVEIRGSRECSRIGSLGVAPGEVVARDLGSSPTSESMGHGTGAEPGKGRRSGNECE